MQRYKMPFRVIPDTAFARIVLLLLCCHTFPLLAQVQCGAERWDRYENVIRGKKVGLIVNQTSRVGGQLLVDFLVERHIQVVKIFAPEHGFRGDRDAGEEFTDWMDPATGIPVVSIYGDRKKPAKADLAGLDYLILDIQDVGARFYTYISSLHYIMEACAENNLELIVLDRPNPNGHYIDGPILEPEYRSFVGMHPVPIVHGLTMGEYARMINGEGWLPNGLHCALQVIPCKNYDHNTFYAPPVKPSPNLPNILSILLYPSLCLFEGTQVSVGRGTDLQFQVIGSPKYVRGEYSFTPESKPGAKNPPFKGVLCRGFNFSQLKPETLFEQRHINLDYLLLFYKNTEKDSFFLANGFFNKLAGTRQLMSDIQNGKNAAEISESWKPALREFQKKRRKYLLYKDFRQNI